MSRLPTFRIEARQAPVGLSGDGLRAWEQGEYLRLAVELARQIVEHDAGCDALAERDADGGATLH